MAWPERIQGEAGRTAGRCAVATGEETIHRTKFNMTSTDYMTQAADFVSKKLGVTIQITREDVLTGAIVEALQWLRDGAPHKALETLEAALKYKP